MKPTEILMEEHRVIERVLTALERAAGRLSRGEEVYLRFFIGTSVFIKNFVDDYHHKKEEGVLFPALVENGLNDEAGPVAMMLAEHEEERRLSQRMRQMTERLQAGDAHARDLVIQSGLGYVRLVRQHIIKEDNVLFPVADKVIPVNQQDQIIEAFNRIKYVEDGEELHAKYYGLADRLVQECIR
jgi:hemerythrin-like domain-containing protein